MHAIFSRHNRYLLSVGAMALAAAGLSGGAYALTESERVDLVADAHRNTLLRGTSAELTDAAHDQESAVDDFLLAREPSSLVRFAEAVEAEADIAAGLRIAAVELPGFRDAVQAAVESNDSWRAAYADAAIEAAKSGDPETLERFLRGATGDHEPVEELLGELTVELDVIDAQLAARESALSTARTTSTILSLAALLAAAGVALWLVRRYGGALERDAEQAGILNRFTEVASFATDDASVARSNLVALGLLVAPDAGVTHVFNRSRDRALPEATLGDPVAETLQLSALTRCSGLVRGSVYVSDDLSGPLSVHCPVYPATVGTLACVPLNSDGSLGAVHLYWSRPHALPLELRASVIRMTEHAALAIGSRRLLAVLQGQANTDPRTGLANSRAFDEALEEALASRSDDETVAVLMIDIDHFKDFNDRHGHPAGDEALRAFASVLRSCVRDTDLAARYGGEEFTVLLPSIDPETALLIAERIRTRTESTVISLAPGMTDRITVSIGMALAPPHGVERVSLLRIADQALYLAKAGGRNVVHRFDGDVDGASTGWSSGAA